MIYFFSKDKYDVDHLRVEPQRIILKSDWPVHLRPYRTSPIHEKEIKDQVEKLLQAGLIKESNSPYSAPVTLAFKRDEGNPRERNPEDLGWVITGATPVDLRSRLFKCQFTATKIYMVVQICVWEHHQAGTTFVINPCLASRTGIHPTTKLHSKNLDFHPVCLKQNWKNQNDAPGFQALVPAPGLDDKDMAPYVCYTFHTVDFQ
ncbi:transposon Tf2-8 polyprotein [Trichonephila clavipes]|nr:transposon Tf2-8 polyprotein [Trichonephila clavipes]